MSHHVERILTPFGFSSTADEVMRGVDLRGKRAIVTGGASGIGLETTRALANAGASVVVAARRPGDAAPVIESLCRETENPGISVAHLDLDDLDSVKRFAASWLFRNAACRRKAWSCSLRPTIWDISRL
jgi:NAD(P)-dependent dehydrogenase (short-subunit alcohol dehydrogenase family)